MLLRDYTRDVHGAEEWSAVYLRVAANWKGPVPSCLRV